MKSAISLKEQLTNVIYFIQAAFLAMKPTGGKLLVFQSGKPPVNLLLFSTSTKSCYFLLVISIIFTSCTFKIARLSVFGWVLDEKKFLF